MALRSSPVFKEKMGEITKLEKELAGAEENHAWAVLKHKKDPQSPYYNQYAIDLLHEQIIKIQAQLKERIDKCREMSPALFQIRVLEKDIDELETVLRVGNKCLSPEKKAELRETLHEKDELLSKLRLNNLG